MAIFTQWEDYFLHHIFHIYLVCISSQVCLIWLHLLNVCRSDMLFFSCEICP